MMELVPGIEHPHIIIGTIDKGKDDLGQFVNIVVFDDPIVMGLSELSLEHLVQVQQVFLETVVEGLFREYPPYFPLVLLRMRAFLSSTKMDSKNFSGILSSRAMVLTETGPASPFSAKCTNALMAYLVFFDSTVFLGRP